jgi:methyltransferase
MTAIVALVVALALMLLELQVSTRNEAILRARGAIAAPDPVYRSMRWAYPAMFVMMAIEGWMSGPASASVLAAGLAIFGLGKVLKTWAIRSLGTRWTYRVFVLPGHPLVARGPYRWLRHPNYLAVIGELLGFALVVAARWSGIVAVLFFGELLRRRIRSEEAALGLSRHGNTC